MNTNNYGISLMIPAQVNKDIAFNEAVSILDSFCNIAIEGFVENIPTEINLGSYIIKSGKNKNYICYCPSKASGFKLQKPNKSMIFYVKSERNFFIYNNDEWEAI